MAEVLARFPDALIDGNGKKYLAQAVGAPTADGLWEGWIEFIPIGTGVPIRSPRETTQPKRADAVYWATGLTSVYLEGALNRALNPPVRKSPEAPTPVFDAPAGRTVVESGWPAPTGAAVLDPFSVYEKGETLLRQQLTALSPWHLVNIITAYDLSDEPVSALNSLSPFALMDLIIEGVRDREPSKRR